MARSQQASNKREKEKKKQKKRQEKDLRKQERKKNSTKGLGLDTMPTAVNAPQKTTTDLPPPVRSVAVSHSNEVKVGKVVFLDAQKNYGFIRDAKVKENLFFGTADLAWEVRLNDLVMFTRIKTSRGSTATSIEKLADDSQT